MSLQIDQKAVLNYARSKLMHLYDPVPIFVEEAGLRKGCEVEHKGCYIGIVDADDNEILREGFIVAKADNVLSSIDKCIETAFARLKSLGFLKPQFVVSKMHVVIVSSCDYIHDPLAWDIDKDGVYFQWGDRYKELYLPYQVKKLNLPKTAVLDRLVGWGCGLACNLWRLPEGLVFRLGCVSIS